MLNYKKKYDPKKDYLQSEAPYPIKFLEQGWWDKMKQKLAQLVRK